MSEQHQHETGSDMRTIDLFYVKHELKEIPLFSDHVQFQDHFGPAAVARGEGRDEEIYHRTMSHRTFPVELMINADGSRQYVAVEPALKDALTRTWREKLRLVVQDRQDISYKLLTAQNEKQSWWAQPWYRRVWSALTEKPGGDDV